MSKSVLAWDECVNPDRETVVNKVYIIILRAVVGAGIAVLMMRMFYPQAPLVYTGLLWIFLVGMAYLLEYFHKRKPKGDQIEH